MADILRVTKQHHCAVCHKPDFCGYSADGTLAFCMRVPSDKQAKNGAYIHVLADAPAVRPPPPPPMADLSRRLFSAQSYWDRLDRVTERYDLDGLALNLGVDVTALERLHARYDPQQFAYAFPMRDGDGTMVGIRLRGHDGDKWAVKHSAQGLFYDLALDERVSEVLQSAPKFGRAVCVCEGPTDTAAAMTLGLPAVGRPSCSGGVEQLRVLLRRIGVRRVVVIADNDEAKRRPDGSVWYPGREGATALVKALDMQHKMLVTPPKDMRKWLCAGATMADVLERLELMDWR